MINRAGARLSGAVAADRPAPGNAARRNLEVPTMTPHHKPRNVTLTKIARLSRGDMSRIQYVPDTPADLAVKGQHLGFDVACAALERDR